MAALLPEAAVRLVLTKGAVCDPKATFAILQKSSISVMHWTEKSEFRGIDLHDSWVLSWSLIKNRLTFEIEASIWPDSPFYEPPLPDEYTCYKRAQLEFDGFQAVHGLKPMDQVNPGFDASGSRDFGNIDELEDTENGYRICGDFGSVHIVGGTMQFEVRASY